MGAKLNKNSETSKKSCGLKGGKRGPAVGGRFKTGRLELARPPPPPPPPRNFV